MALSGSLSTSKYDGRYYTLSWTATQDISTNKSKVSWTLKAVGGNSSWYAERDLIVKIAGITVFSKSARKERYTGTIDTGTITLTHDSSGNKSFSASVKAAVYTSSINCTGSKSFTLNQIPRAAVVNAASNFNDEESPYINYVNAAGDSVESLQACIAKDDGIAILVPYRDIDKNGTSYTFELTEDERNTLRNACIDANSMQIKFYIKTVIGGNTFLNSLERTLSIINASPVFTATAVNVKQSTLELTGDRLSIIKGNNTVLTTIQAEALKGASIASYRVINGGNESTLSSDYFADVAEGLFSFTVKDSRGNTSTKEVSLNVVDYTPLTCNIDAKISLNDADSTKANINFTVSGNYFNGSFGAVNNTLTLLYELEDSSGGVYSEALDLSQATFSGNTYSLSHTVEDLDYRNSYTVICTAADKLNSSVKSTSKTLKATPVYDWGEEDFNLNVPLHMSGNTVLRHTDANKVVLSAEGADIYLRPNGSTTDAGQLRLFTDGKATLDGARILTADLIYPVGSIYMSLNDVNPSTLFGGSWEQIKDRFLLAAGDNYAAGSTGGEAEHTLTVSEIPSHHHTVWGRSVYSGTGSYIGLCNKDNSSSSYATGNTGGGQPHNNMPPYLAIYMWKRVA